MFSLKPHQKLLNGKLNGFVGGAHEVKSERLIEFHRPLVFCRDLQKGPIHAMAAETVQGL